MTDSEREKEVRVPGSPTRCPWCKDDLADVKEIVACAACGARHHAACHSENGRCATCGTADVLVPRVKAKSEARSRLEVPPQGSKIVVARNGDEVTYSWPAHDTLDVWGCALILTVIGAPLGIYLIYLAQQRKARRDLVRMVLGEAALRVFVGALPAPRLDAPRSAIGAVRVNTVEGGGHQLTVDVGVTRHLLGAASHLKAPELEWLARVIDAWKDEA